MKDGLYRHINWNLTVRIENQCITELVSEPWPHVETLWPVVREEWIRMIRDRRRISEDERAYFRRIV